MTEYCKCGNVLEGVGPKSGVCLECKRANGRRKSQRQRELGKESASERRRYQENRARAQERNRQKWATLRAEVIAGYGNRCACCGEDTYEFLTVDHTNGDGAPERRQYGSRAHILAAKREGFPARFQVLCWNCNCARQHNGGICPHEKAVRVVLGLAA